MQSRPFVGVVIPVRNSQRTIRQSVQSILNQDYKGILAIWIVGNSEDQDNTWSALGDLVKDLRVHCIKFPRPSNWSGRDANIKRFYGCEAAACAGVDFILLIDSQVFVPPDWLTDALKRMTEHGIDGVTGRSHRRPEDRSLCGIYQDTSLVSEFPRYGPKFLLSQETFGKAPGLPTTVAFLLSRRVFEGVRDTWPIHCTHGWEDFLLAWRIALRGFTILCTDNLLVYRNHKRKFRLIKHFSAGAGAYLFHKDYPDCGYSSRLKWKALLVVALFITMVFVPIVSLFTMGFPGLLDFFFAFFIEILPFSIVNIIKSRDWRGIIFPMLDVLHVSIWIIGAAYAAMRKGRVDPAVDQFLLRFR